MKILKLIWNQKIDLFFALSALGGFLWYAFTGINLTGFLWIVTGYAIGVIVFKVRLNLLRSKDDEIQH